MKTHPLYPLMFRPQYKEYAWGGQTIAERFNRANTPHTCAESWELSALPEADSIITNGAFEGTPLSALVQTFGTDLVGTAAPNSETFPLLIKLLDVHTRRSVKVHPAQGPAAKHKMWYLLGAQPDACVWAGATPGATLETLPEHLIAFPTRPEEVFDIPAGMVHCLGAGNLIFEVQQAHTMAYRLHDWGQGHPLHCNEARDAIRWELATQALPAPQQRHRDLSMRLATADFTFATLHLERERRLHTTAQSFMVLFCTRGKTTLGHAGPHPLTLLPGDLVLVPPKQQMTLHPLMKTHLLITTL